MSWRRRLRNGDSCCTGHGSSAECDGCSDEGGQYSPTADRMRRRGAIGIGRIAWAVAKTSCGIGGGRAGIGSVPPTVIGSAVAAAAVGDDSRICGLASAMIVHYCSGCLHCDDSVSGHFGICRCSIHSSSDSWPEVGRPSAI